MPGWRINVQKAKLPEPVKTDDGEISEGVKRITWTSGTGIPAGAFQDFGLSVQVPGKAGDALTFKALQTYSNGEVVRWIGPEGSDNPAPKVELTAGSDGQHAAPRPPRPPRRPRTAVTAAARMGSRSRRWPSVGSGCWPARRLAARRPTREVSPRPE